MPDEFQFDVFLSHSAKDKAVVRPIFVAAPRQSAAFSSAGMNQNRKMAALCRVAATKHFERQSLWHETKRIE
jgi:hypothetical protein